MKETDIKLCRICLKNNKETVLTENSTSNFFYELTLKQNIPEKFLLCLWCKAAFMKLVDLIQALVRPQETKLDDNNDRKINFTKHKRKFNLSYHQNNHIDIPPIEEKHEESIDNLRDVTEEVKLKANINTNSHIFNEHEETSKNNKTIILFHEEVIVKHEIVKIEDFNNLETDDMQYENFCEKINNEEDNIERRANRKKLNCDELKFDVKFLTLEQQKKEIEEKRHSKKFKNMKFQCKSCGVGFLTNEVFTEHVLRHEEISGPFQCEVCDLRFRSHDVLSQHSLAHRRRFTCGLCGAVFKRWSHCIAHRHKCGNSPVLEPCQYCKKIFNDIHSLNIHVQGVHKREKKYECQQCDSRFSTKQRLTVHMRIHTGSKPFACEQCPRKFATNSNLQAHQSVHIEQRQYYCVECDTRYKSVKNLRRHLTKSARHLAKET